METLDPKAKRLVEELETRLNLGKVDSRRAAFVVMAISKGWRKAKVARYLGTSRARVGQRVTKYEEYADAATGNGVWPAIQEFLPPQKYNGGVEPKSAQVAFKAEDWENLAFADSLLNRLV